MDQKVLSGSRERYLGFQVILNLEFVSSLSVQVHCWLGCLPLVQEWTTLEKKTSKQSVEYKR